MLELRIYVGFRLQGFGVWSSQGLGAKGFLGLGSSPGGL